MIEQKIAKIAKKKGLNRREREQTGNRENPQKKEGGGTGAEEQEETEEVFLRGVLFQIKTRLSVQLPGNDKTLQFFFVTFVAFC